MIAHDLHNIKVQVGFRVRWFRGKKKTQLTKKNMGADMKRASPNMRVRARAARCL